MFTCYRRRQKERVFWSDLLFKLKKKTLTSDAELHFTLLRKEIFGKKFFFTIGLQKYF